MKERHLMVGAVAVGVLAVGGLGLYARHRNSPAPRVLGHTLIEATERRGPIVRISFEPSPALLHLAQEGETWEYRVAEPNGRIFVTAPSSDEHTRRVDVPYLYARPPVAPRLEVWHEGRLLGWTGLGSLPLPRVAPLTTERAARIRAFHVSPNEVAMYTAGDPEQEGAIRLAPRTSLAPNECWVVQVVKTSTGAPYRSLAAIFPEGTPKNDSSRARLHYASEIDAVRVRVERWVHRKRRERVVLRGLRLVQKGGQTVFDWKGDRLPNPFGPAFMRFEKGVGYSGHGEIVGGKVLTPPEDARSPVLAFVNQFRGEASLFGSNTPTGNVMPEFALNLFYQGIKMEFAHEEFDRLGLRYALIGDAQWQDSEHDVRRPVDPRSFDVALWITKEWNEKVGTFEATIPVEPAQTF